MSAIQCLKDVFWGNKERQYSAYGEIVFKIKMFFEHRSSSPELREQMLLAIREVDELHPWSDFSWEGLALTSINVAKFTNDQFVNWCTPELHVWFQIEPTGRFLSKGQIYAYEKYLETLAEKLAEKEEFVGKATVRSLCHFCKSSAEFRG